MTEILVVDDEPSVRDFLIAFLEQRGNRVQGVGDGHAALAVAQKQRPDVIFLDIIMPGMDGIETLRRLRDEVPESTVIMISGISDQDLALRALSLGAYDFIRKPFDLDYLEKVVLLKLSTAPEEDKARQA